MVTILEVPANIFSTITENAIKLQHAYGDYIYNNLLLKEMQDQYYNTLIDFPGTMFTRPTGIFFVAYDDHDNSLGIIGLRKFKDDVCEMKRFYVDPQYRGNGVGKLLVSRIIQTAKEFGYKKMYLDTDPRMPAAIKIYKSYGFIEIEPYYSSLNTDGVYMELLL